MKDTKHTPGPWTVHGLTVCETTQANRDGSTGGGFVAACYDPDVEGFALDDELFAQAEANAQLISRAPELLEDNEQLREVNAELSKHLSAVIAAFHRYSEAMRQKYSAGYGDNGGIIQDAQIAIAKANQP